MDLEHNRQAPHQPQINNVAQPPVQPAVRPPAQPEVQRPAPPAGNQPARPENKHEEAKNQDPINWGLVLNKDAIDPTDIPYQPDLDWRLTEHPNVQGALSYLMYYFAWTMNHEAWVYCRNGLLFGSDVTAKEALCRIIPKLSQRISRILYEVYYRDPAVIKIVDASSVTAHFRTVSDAFGTLQSMGYLVPSKKFWRQDFLEQILSKRKNLLQRKDVKDIDPPSYPEILRCIPLWICYPDLERFIPDYSDKMTCDNKFFFTILNYLYSEVIAKLVEKVRHARMTFKTPTEQNPLESDILMNLKKFQNPSSTSTFRVSSKTSVVQGYEVSEYCETRVVKLIVPFIVKFVPQNNT
jgi:hypothetical protein